MTFLNAVQEADAGARAKCRWTGERIARLGFLIGLGLDAARIATDPIIASTPNNVHRQAGRFGLAFRGIVPCALPPEVAAHYNAAAAKRSMTREGLIRFLLLEIASDPNLLDNILDDDVGEVAV